MRAAHPSKQRTNTRQRACGATPRNTIIIFNTARNSKLYLGFFAIICILYFYLTGIGIVPNLAATAAVSLSAHPLCRRFAVLITTTLPLSN
jgi:predicted small integral membrane protein